MAASPAANGCARCGLLQAHLLEVTAYTESLQGRLLEMNAQLQGHNSDSAMLKHLTSLLATRDATIAAQAKQLDDLKVQATLARVEADNLRKELQQLQAANRLMASAVGSLSAPSASAVPPPSTAPAAAAAIDAPLSASMLGAPPSASASSAVGLLGLGLGIQERAVPLLSGTQRAQVVEHMARAAASGSAGQRMGGGLDGSAALPAHARRRALLEKEGQSGARPQAPPSGSQRFDGSRAAAGAVSGPPGPTLQSSLSAASSSSLAPASSSSSAFSQPSVPQPQAKPVARAGLPVPGAVPGAGTGTSQQHQVGQAAALPLSAAHGGYSSGAAAPPAATAADPASPLSSATVTAGFFPLAASSSSAASSAAQGPAGAGSSSSSSGSGHEDATTASAAGASSRLPGAAAPTYRPVSLSSTRAAISMGGVGSGVGAGGAAAAAGAGVQRAHIASSAASSSAGAASAAPFAGPAVDYSSLPPATAATLASDLAFLQQARNAMAAAAARAGGAPLAPLAALPSAHLRSSLAEGFAVASSSSAGAAGAGGAGVAAAQPLSSGEEQQQAAPVANPMRQLAAQQARLGQAGAPAGAGVPASRPIASAASASASGSGAAGGYAAFSYPTTAAAGQRPPVSGYAAGAAANQGYGQGQGQSLSVADLQASMTAAGYGGGATAAAGGGYGQAGRGSAGQDSATGTSPEAALAEDVLLGSARLGRLTQQIDMLRSSISALQAS